MRHDFDLVAADLGDGNGVAQVAGAAIDLDALREELLEGGDIEDFVRNGLGAVDGVLLHAELATGRRERKRRAVPSWSPWCLSLRLWSWRFSVVCCT